MINIILFTRNTVGLHKTRYWFHLIETDQRNFWIMNEMCHKAVIGAKINAERIRWNTFFSSAKRTNFINVCVYIFVIYALISISRKGLIWHALNWWSSCGWCDIYCRFSTCHSCTRSRNWFICFGRIRSSQILWLLLTYTDGLSLDLMAVLLGKHILDWSHGLLEEVFIRNFSNSSTHNYTLYALQIFFIHTISSALICHNPKFNQVVLINLSSNKTNWFSPMGVEVGIRNVVTGCALEVKLL